ncbi:hypothetical protein QE152_g14234 [Popillia japonica]|uniref:Uncharacterized protein n=1 Tax=Popillia japonica TaxID=7064 RepID=A0AAW1LA48_POPJA
MDLVLLPPQDGQDTDLDDAPSDGEGKCNIRDIGKRVLKQPMQVVVVGGEDEKRVEQADKERHNEESSDSDDIPLARLFGIKTVANRKAWNTAKAKKPMQRPTLQRQRNPCRGRQTGTKKYYIVTKKK